MYAFTPRLALALLTLLLGLSITFFGANFPFAQGLLPIPCAILAGLSLACPLYIPVARNNRLLVAAIFLPVVFVIIWGVMQLLPLGGHWASQFWGLVPPGMQTISMAPGLTMVHVVYAAGLLLLAWASYIIGGSSPHAILRMVAILIALACAYGIFQFAIGNDHVLWLPKTSYKDFLSGTFINRNTFATLAGLGVLANFALMLQRVGEISSRLTLRQRFKAFWLLVLRPGWGWMLLAAICFIALLLTASRAGITASLCGILVLFGSLAGMRGAARWPLAAIMFVFIAFAMLMLAAVGDELGSRLLRVVEDASFRQDINQGSLRLTEQFWLTGTGFGSYLHAFYTVHTPEFLGALNAVIDHAHNTYLELAAELGLPALFLLLVALVALATAYAIGLNTRRRAIMWPALGASTLVLVGGHALADFSLSIPAFAMITIVVLMVALAQSFPSGSSQPQATAPSALGRARFGILLPVVVVSAIAGWQSWANYHALLASKTVQQLVSLQPVGPGPMFVAQRHLMRCASINPWHPTCKTDLAQVYMSLATGYGLTGPRSDVGMVYLTMAKEAYLQALNQSPVNPHAWYRLARIEAFLNNRPQAGEYLANSVLTGPAESALAYQRIPLMLDLYPTAGADNKSLFATNILAHWNAAGGRTARHIRANPSVQQALAEILPNTPEQHNRWRSLIRTRFPVPAPLGETPETR